MTCKAGERTYVKRTTRWTVWLEQRFCEVGNEGVQQAPLQDFGKT